MHRAFIKLREKNHSAGFNFYLTKGLIWKLVFIVVVVVVVCLFVSVVKSANNLYSKSEVGYVKFVTSYCSH